MDIYDYKFKVGDEVITIDGERGEIVSICECEECQKRGFYEPTWRSDYDDDEAWITDISVKHGFRSFYKIGDYYFNKFNREWVEDRISATEDKLATLRGQLRLIDEFEHGKLEE